MLTEIVVLDDKESNVAMIVESLVGLPVKIKRFKTVGALVGHYSRKYAKLPAIAILDYFVDGSDGNPGSLGTEAVKLLHEKARLRSRTIKIIGYSSIAACSRKIAAQGYGYIALQKPKGSYTDPILRKEISFILESAKGLFK